MQTRKHLLLFEFAMRNSQLSLFNLLLREANLLFRKAVVGYADYDKSFWRDYDRR